jgi:MFS family permease
VHQIAYAQDRGVDKIAAAASLSVVGLAGFLGQFFFGWLSDRIGDVKYSAVIGVMFMLAGLVILRGAGSTAALFVYSFIFGFGYGCLAPMLPIVIADRFGRSDLGPVYGMVTLLLGIGGCIGPLAAGMIYDSCGSYDLVWISDIGILAFAGLLLAALKRKKQINL